jgi:hypothetical protein
MADLRSLFADLGYDQVRTLLNSGNVVFRAPRDHAGPWGRGAACRGSAPARRPG